MIKRLKTSTGVAAGIAALALGGSAIAGAASTTATKASPAPRHEASNARDADNIQSGSQTAPDPTGTASTRARDGDNIQSGSQTTPDRGSTSKAESSTSETSSESGGESTANNDGPGGHADEPGNPNADTQQQGQN